MFWFEISPLILVRCTLAPSKMNGAKIETFINSPMIVTNRRSFCALSCICKV